MSQHVEVRRIIVQLLSNMSESREVRSYLRRFSSVDETRFGVIKVGGAIIRDHLEETAGSLALLHTVGLTPVVIHGGGPQLDAALAAKGVTSEKRNGLRVTTPEVLDVAREVFAEQNLALVEAIRSHGVPAHGITEGIFDAEFIDQDLYGFVGEPTAVRVDRLRSIIRSGAIPILGCLGVATGGQILNMNADTATRLLVEVLQPMKIIFLSDTGGLLDGEGKLIEWVNLETDYEDLMAQEWLHSGMRLKIEEIKRLLDASPDTSSVSITTPKALIRELFTHGGAGTLIRKGERILEIEDRDEVDTGKLTALLETSFGRKLRADWWENLSFQSLIVSESYRGAALVTRVEDFAYLDKYAVAESARGDGTARSVWDTLVRSYPVLFWRSRVDNPINGFYTAEADGLIRRGRWLIFWRGEADFDRIARAVKTIDDMPTAWEGEA
ncbi:MAG: acetylglutamate kinase [Actinomycetes bacterium]|nr:MAG: acetylglutamate kinase [Actinomycetota bacterium]